MMNRLAHFVMKNRFKCLLGYNRYTGSVIAATTMFGAYLTAGTWSSKAIKLNRTILLGFNFKTVTFRTVSFAVHTLNKIKQMLWDKLFIFTWFILLSVAFAAAESCWPASEPPGFVHRLHNFAVVVVVAGVMAILGGVASRLPAIHLPSLIGSALDQSKPNGISKITLTTFAYAFVWDFFQYWAHRLQHVVPALWETHALHHDDQHLNSTTSLRLPVLGRVVTIMLVTLPTNAICSEDWLGLYEALFLFVSWNFFNHANIRLSMGYLTPIISGPQWHRLHHAMDERYKGKNFAAFFPIWDIAFGTYLAPQKDEYPQSGLHGRATLPSSIAGFLRPIFSMTPSSSIGLTEPYRRPSTSGPQYRKHEIQR